MEGMLLNHVESVSNELTDIRGVYLNSTLSPIRPLCPFTHMDYGIALCTWGLLSFCYFPN